MKKALLTFLLLGSSTALKGLRGHYSGHMELTRLRMSLMYVRSVRTFRLLFISLLAMGLCMVFLFTGLVLFHLTLFLYSPWSIETKMLIGFLCSVIYLMMAVVLFYKIFAQDNWMKIFNAEGIINHLKGEAGPKQEGKKE